MTSIVLVPHVFAAMTIIVAVVVATALLGFGGTIFGIYVQVVRDAARQDIARRPPVVQNLEDFLSFIMFSTLIAIVTAIVGVVWLIAPEPWFWWVVVVLLFLVLWQLVWVMLRLRKFIGEG